MAIKGGRPVNRRVVAHLMVRNATEAVEFYQRALGAEELYRSTLPDGRVIHAHLKIADSVIQVTDESLAFDEEGVARAEAGMPTRSPQTLGGTSTILEMYVEDVDAAFKRAIDAGAEPKIGVADMFFGDRYGQLTDPFGHVWALATMRETLTPEEIDRRAMEHFAPAGR